MKLSALALFLCLFFACANTNQQPAGETEAPTGDTVPAATETPAEAATQAMSTRQSPAPPPEKFEESLSDGKVTFKIVSDNNETSTVRITTEGLENRQFSTEFQVEAQLTEAHLLDLNADGFSEIYLIFNVTGDSGNKLLKGWSSYRNKSAGEIYVKDTDLPRTMGSDRVYVRNGKLYRSFEMVSGEARRFGYQLSKGESSFVLEPVKQ